MHLPHKLIFKEYAGVNLMGKYLLYALIALVIAFGLNFFNVVEIPWLDVPFSMEAKQEGAQKVDNALQEATENK